MTFLRRHAVPLAAACAAAAAAFTVVALTTDGGGRAPPSRPAPASPPAAPVRAGQADGLAMFWRMGCGSCHQLAAAGSVGRIGPDLDARLPDHTRESLTAAIVSPPFEAAMPANFGERMTDAELTSLVDFLLSVRKSR